MNDLLKRLKAPTRPPKFKLNDEHMYYLRQIDAAGDLVVLRQRGTTDLPTFWNTFWDLTERGYASNFRTVSARSVRAYHFQLTDKGKEAIK